MKTNTLTLPRYRFVPKAWTQRYQRKLKAAQKAAPPLPTAQRIERAK